MEKWEFVKYRHRRACMAKKQQWSGERIIPTFVCCRSKGNFYTVIYTSELKYRNVNLCFASDSRMDNQLSMNKKFVIYRRVSTSRQFQSGLGLGAQADSVRRYLLTQPDSIVLADMVEAESGKNDERPILRQAVELCRKESATLLVSKIDRLCRSLRLIMMLEQYRVPFIAADNPEMNELVCHIMVAIGQSERKTIAARVRDALRQAKLRGVKLGGPNICSSCNHRVHLHFNAPLSSCKNVTVQTPVIIAPMICSA
jgi:DNA invertase Pin-like site-specific DNA recombinase